MATQFVDPQENEYSKFAPAPPPCEKFKLISFLTTTFVASLLLPLFSLGLPN